MFKYSLSIYSLSYLKSLLFQINGPKLLIININIYLIVSIDALMGNWASSASEVPVPPNKLALQRSIYKFIICEVTKCVT